MTKINRYIIYYLQEIGTDKHLYYNYFRYNENEKITIQNINKEINRQKKNITNKNYENLIKIISNKSYTINIVKHTPHVHKNMLDEYNKLIELPQYQYRQYPSLKIYNDDLTDKEKTKIINKRILDNDNHNKKIDEKRNRLKNYLIKKYNCLSIKFYDKTLKDMKIELNEFLKTNNLNGLNTNQYDPKKKVTCANCSKTFSLGNISHHYRIYHKDIYFKNITKDKYDYLSLN